LILLAERSASALYLRGNLHAGWGIQLGGTETPCVTPCVSPRWRASDGRIGRYMLVLHAIAGTGYGGVRVGPDLP
jgi:hypothetical protein